jgi:hypothetical protein
MNELKLELEKLEDRIAPCGYDGYGDYYGSGDSGDTYQNQNYNSSFTYQDNYQNGNVNINVQVDDTQIDDNNTAISGYGDAIANDDGTVNNDSAVA